MCDILFRGKRLDNREWAYGYLFVSDTDNSTFIVCGSWSVKIEFEVDPATVGQYTRLTDKNGVKIFKGDVVHCIGGEFFQGYHEVDENIVIEDITDGVCVYLGEVETVEIVGNIYDNPELLNDT